MKYPALHIAKEESSKILNSSIPSGAKTQKKEKNDISQMRLRSVFKMQTSILSTATTEHLGYVIFSFFVCFFFRLFSFTNKNYLFSFLAAIIVSTTALTTASNPSSSTVSSSGTLNAAVTIDIL